MADRETEAASNLVDSASFNHLEEFEGAYKSCFNFKSISEKDILSIYSNIFDIISIETENDGLQIIKALCCLRILTRDEHNVDLLNADKQCYILLERIIYCIDKWHEGSLKVDGVLLEALKSLSNIIYHGSKHRLMCSDFKLSEKLTQAIKAIELNNNLNTVYFSLRVLFLLSAFEIKEREFMLKDYHTVEVIVLILADVDLSLAETEAEQLTLHITIASEILKVLFNITLPAKDNEILPEFEDLVKVLRKLTWKVKSLPTVPDSIFAHIINMLVNVPHDIAESLFTDENAEKTMNFFVDGIEMSIKNDSGVSNEAFFASFSCLCRTFPPLRKHLKKAILPPTKEFNVRPEQQENLKGRVVKLMTDVNHEVKGAVADFLFVLCKENVSRLVKHTGYGNAAGLLASRGLLGGGKSQSSINYSSDDENESDTEEYISVQNQIDPITGAIKTDNENPCEELTEDEKEIEAEKLMNLIGRLDELNVIKPMMIGPDGKPQELNLNNFQRQQDDSS